MYYYDTVVGNPSPAEWVDIADEIRADYNSWPISDLCDQWSFYAIDYREVSTAGLLSFEVVPTAGSIAGGNINDPVPTQIALLVSVKGLTTKPNRARSYLCGFQENHIVLGLFGSGVRGNAETFIDLQSVLNSGGTNPMLRSAVQWNSSHTQVIVDNDISTSASIASIVPATQRRRRIGVGI